MPLAESMTITVMMAILATMDIVKGVDANGKELDVNVKTTGAFIEYVRIATFGSFDNARIIILCSAFIVHQSRSSSNSSLAQSLRSRYSMIPP